MEEAEIMALPRRALGDRTMLTLVGCVAAIIVGEACIAYWNVSVGALVEGALLLILVNRFLLSRTDDTPQPGSKDGVRVGSEHAALALAFVPLVRLLSLSMAVGDIAPVARYVVVGAPVLAGALLALALDPFEKAAHAAWSWQVQGPIGLLGIPLGLAAFGVAGRPDGLVESDDWALLAIGAVSLIIFTGFAEELLFRGVLQTGLTPVFGPASPGVTALVFGATYLAVGSGAYVVYVTLVGFGFGWLVHRTGSLLGVSIAHGLMNVGLLLVWPLILK